MRGAVKMNVFFSNSFGFGHHSCNFYSADSCQACAFNTRSRYGWGNFVSSLIAVRGEAEQLEQTVDGLIWLKKSGAVRSNVLIADFGLSESGRKMAELLAKDNDCVTVCLPDEIADVVEEINGREFAVHTD
jgi:hypothetical protein